MGQLPKNNTENEDLTVLYLVFVSIYFPEIFCFNWSEKLSYLLLRNLHFSLHSFKFRIAILIYYQKFSGTFDNVWSTQIFQYFFFLAILINCPHTDKNSFLIKSIIKDCNLSILWLLWQETMKRLQYYRNNVKMYLFKAEEKFDLVDKGRKI